MCGTKITLLHIKLLHDYIFFIQFTFLTVIYLLHYYVYYSYIYYSWYWNKYVQISTYIHIHIVSLINILTWWHSTGFPATATFIVHSSHTILALFSYLCHLLTTGFVFSTIILSFLQYYFFLSKISLFSIHHHLTNSKPHWGNEKILVFFIFSTVWQWVCCQL